MSFYGKPPVGRLDINFFSNPVALTGKTKHICPITHVFYYRICE
jgi:hypothetical protein